MGPRTTLWMWGPDNIMAISCMHSSPFIVMCLVAVFPSLESMSQRTVSDLSGSLLSPLCVCCAMLSCFSHVRLFVSPWTVTLQALLTMGFSRQDHWIGLPCLPPGDLPDPEIEPASLMSPALANGFFTTNATWEAPLSILVPIKVNLRFLKP